MNSERPLSTRSESARAGSTPTRHLNQIDLSRRWCLSPRTLERWRWLKEGPNYLKVGGRIIYRLEDIEAYEGKHLRHVVENRPREA